MHLAPRRLEVAVQPLGLPPDEVQVGAVAAEEEDGGVADDGASACNKEFHKLTQTVILHL